MPLTTAVPVAAFEISHLQRKALWAGSGISRAMTESGVWGV